MKQDKFWTIDLIIGVIAVAIIIFVALLAYGVIKP
jgi:hypothetical protein